MKKEWIQLIVRLSGVFLFVFQIGISHSMLPASVEERSPIETGVYQEYFSSYNNLDYVQDLEWNIWEGLLRIPLMDGVNQEQPQVASDHNSNTYVIWQDERSGDYDIYAQKLDGNGNPLWETEVRLNSDSGNQNDPEAVVDLNGDLVVVWESDAIIYAQKLDEDGNQLWVDEVYIAGDDVSWYYTPAIAVDSNNDIVIVYAGWGNFGYNIGIWAQKLDESGNLLWPDFMCIGGADNGNWVPAVAVDNDDNIIVAWVDSRDEYDYDFDIYAIKMNSNHTGLWGAAVRVNSDVIYARQMDPKIAVDSGGNIYIVWGDERNGNSDIYAQKLSESGSKLWSGDKRMDSDSGTAIQKRPDMTEVGFGDLVIVWEDYRNANADIFAQKIDSNGNVLGANDVRVHTYSGTADQRLPAVALDSSGYLVVAWEDYRHSESDIYAQKLNINGSRLWEYDVRVPVNLDSMLAGPNIFYLSSGAAQSRTVDTVAGHIRQANLTANYRTNGGEVRFFLSHNGGNSWSQVIPGVTKVFFTPGSDLRWRVELEADPLRLNTPVIDSLRIDYSTQVSQGYVISLPVVFR